MFKIINIITNNYFLKKKLKVASFNSPIRRINDNWQGRSRDGEKIINGEKNSNNISNFNKFLFLRVLSHVFFHSDTKDASLKLQCIRQTVNGPL